MPNLIDSEELLKWIEKNVQHDSMYVSSDELVVKILSLQPASPKMSVEEAKGWISVRDNPPPFGLQVLVWCKIYGIYIGCNERIEGTGYGNWNDGKENGVLPPIYWKSLPESPTI